MARYQQSLLKLARLEVNGQLPPGFSPSKGFHHFLIALGAVEKSPAVRRHVAEALVNKGSVLADLERTGDAIALFDEIDRRFGREDTYDARSAAFSAAREKASIFEKRGDLDTVIAIYDELDWRFSRSNQDDSRTWAKKVRQRKSEAEQKKAS